MRFIGNLIWLFFGGFISSILWMIAGLALCLTIIGIPFGLQALKIAALTLTPFDREVEIGSFGTAGALANLLWILFFGWELMIFHVVSALLLTITIVGIPFAKQHIKLARLSLIPFGAEIYYD